MRNSKLELKPQNKDVMRVLIEALPQNTPAGMQQYLDDDSISISIEPSVSNRSVSLSQSKKMSVKDEDKDKDNLSPGGGLIM